MAMIIEKFKADGIIVDIRYQEPLFESKIINQSFVEKVEKGLRNYYGFGKTTNLNIGIDNQGTIEIDYNAGGEGAYGLYHFFDVVNGKILYDFVNEHYDDDDKAGRSSVSLGQELNMYSEFEELFFEFAEKALTTGILKLTIYDILVTKNIDVTDFALELRKRIGDEKMEDVYNHNSHDVFLPPSVKDIFLF